MTTTTQIMFPPGRWVSASIYDKQTKDDKGQPIPAEKQGYSIGYALPKTPGRDWRQEPWGQQIVAAAQADWPNGEANHPAFSWKVKDGDAGPNPNRIGSKANNQKEGWPGHWVLFFSSKFDAPIVNANGSENFALRAQKQIKKGDYIQIFGSVKGTNGRSANAGCYLNHDVIAFVGKGQEIVSANRPDPTKLGFGGALPAGATAVSAPAGAMAIGAVPPAAGAPASAGTSALGEAMGYGFQQAAAGATFGQVAVQPHTAFLTPGAPAAPVVPTSAPVAPPVRQMTGKAPGVTYEAFMAQGGWTDDLLRQHGYMF